MIKKTGRATDPTQRTMQNVMLYGIPVSLLVSGSIFPIGSVIYYVTTNLFSLGQQFYVLRKFPPPVNPNQPVRPAKAGGKVAAKAQDTSKKNGTPVKQVRAVAPKPGAKPINPKKGNVSKRLPK
jgi:YidC/Oxa1 family membrane protein insertase